MGPLAGQEAAELYPGGAARAARAQGRLRIGGGGPAAHVQTETATFCGGSHVTETAATASISRLGRSQCGTGSDSPPACVADREPSLTRRLLVRASEAGSVLAPRRCSCASIGAPACACMRGGVGTHVRVALRCACVRAGGRAYARVRAGVHAPACVAALGGTRAIEEEAVRRGMGGGKAKFLWKDQEENSSLVLGRERQRAKRRVLGGCRLHNFNFERIVKNNTDSDFDLLVK